MAISFAATNAAFGSNSNSVTPAYPSGLRQDDLLLMVIGDNGNDSVTVPTGWTKIVEQNNGPGLRLTVAWKRHNTGDVSAGTWSKATPSVAWMLRMVAYRGVRATGNPFDVTPTVGTSTGQSVITAPSITTTSDNNTIVMAATWRVDNVSTGNYAGWTTPGTGTMTERMDNATSTLNGASIGEAEGILSTAGPSGAGTVTTGAGSPTIGDNIGALIALVPDPRVMADPIASAEAFGTPKATGAIQVFSRTNDLEMGTDEAVISTANSTATGQHAFNYILSTTAPVFDNATAAHGTMSVRTQHSGTSGSSMVGWDWKAYPKYPFFWRTYFRVSAYPAAQTAFLRLGSATDANQAFLYLNTNGTFFFGSTTSASVIPLNTWVRFEGEISQANQGRLRYHATMDSATITEAIHYNAGFSAVGTFLVGAWTTTAAGPFWFDDIQVAGQDTGWIGPVGASTSRAAFAFGNVDLSGSYIVPVAAEATGLLNLSGTAGAHGVAGATGALSLSGTGNARGAASATGALSLSGTGTARAASSATGSLALSGTSTAKATGSATGAIVLAGSGAARAVAAATGAVVLSGGATIPLAVAAVGVLSISGTSEARPGEPTGLVATAVSGSQIDLTWNAFPDATGYDIERDGVIILMDHLTTAYSDTGLAGGVQYNYRVRAVL